MCSKHTGFAAATKELVAYTDGDIFRYQGASFTFDAQNSGAMPAPGNVSWAGVGDAYFAMAAIPAAPMSGLEFRASKYEVQTEPFLDGIFGWIMRNPTTKETRHLITAYVPVNSDGSTTTKIYTGTKDYFALAAYNQQLSIRRADSVKTALVRNGIAPQAITVNGAATVQTALDSARVGGQ